MICPYCKKETNGGKSFGAHLTNCKENPKRKLIIEKIRNSNEKPLKKYILNCKKCDKLYEVEVNQDNFSKGRYKKFCCIKCSNSRGPRSEDFKIRVRKKLLGVDRGAQKYYCKKCGSPLIRKNKWELCKKCLYKNNEFKNHLSSSLKGKTGGYRDKGGRGNQGWYKGFYCNSSWELAYLLYNLDKNINISRNKTGFSYFFEGKTLKYYPDFIIDGKYYEIKGYMDKKNKAKIDQFPLELKIIDSSKIKFYLDYSIRKYGEKFWDLYEDKK